MRFVADDGDGRAAALHAGGDEGGVVLAFERGDLDELRAQPEIFDEPFGGFARAGEWTVPDFGAGERVVRFEKGGEGAHLVASARAERARGILGGIDGVRVADKEKLHGETMTGRHGRATG